MQGWDMAHGRTFSASDPSGDADSVPLVSQFGG